MSNPLLKKCILLIVIMASLLIPLTMIESTIAERTRHRAEAVQAIASSFAGEQSITGPILMIPVTEEYDEQIKETDPLTSKEKSNIVRKKITHVVKILPKQLNFAGQLNAQKRAYGIHETSVFELQGTITGNFEKPTTSDLPSPTASSTYTWGIPTLSMGIKDVRGITGEPRVQIDEQTLIVNSGVKNPELHQGFHAQGASPVDGNSGLLSFRIDLNLAGTSIFSFIPTGDYTTAELTSNWAHPSFGGDFLPRMHEVTPEGFKAKWSTTALASNSNGNLSGVEGFQVKLIDPVDIYRQATRAVKYGILFIVLGFAAFFTFENLKNLPIHPIQYLLVGLAQALFFLLLTSLSEHIAFSLAYLISAGASITLISIYIASILRSWRSSLGFSVSLILLYAALFGILRSEENALLLGSLLLFVALAALMLSTRSIDWYRIGRKNDTNHITDQ